ncbi:MAG TPA: DUF4410 domain-containing protein [Deltaproteobacteria bacterium]|nr:DUF4410 domain-containing protein [Deltaproteobacteria bacterium]HQB39753.1 DUF4410 domain-containing protein [Deltaproteobacteria bacterium]
MKKIIWMFMLSLTMFSNAFADSETLPKPEVMDEEKIFITTSLSRYNTVVVRDFSTTGAEYMNLDDEEKKIVNEIKPTIVKNMTESIVNHLKKEGKFANVYANRAARGNAIIVKGKFTRFNGGVGAAKFFLGFMSPKSGKTNIAISGELIDAKSGKVLASFVDIRSGGEGGSLGRIRGVMPVQATDEGEVIAEFITKLAK